MEWRQLFSSTSKTGLLQYITQFKQRIFALSSCDLCGLDVQFKPQKMNIQQHLVCQYCLNDLPWFKQELIDGDLLMWPAIHRALPHITFDHLFSLAPYISPFNQWLVQLKYHGRFELGNFFATLLVKQWQLSLPNSSPNIVLSVPLHMSKWQQRGYNQAHLIACHFAKALQLTYLPNALARIKQNESQMGKTGTERRKNLKNSFKLNHDFNDIKHVILVDDVVTTGTTASELSTLLKSAGVETVSLVTVCLTLPKA